MHSYSKNIWTIYRWLITHTAACIMMSNSEKPPCSLSFKEISPLSYIWLTVAIIGNPIYSAAAFFFCQGFGFIETLGSNESRVFISMYVFFLMFVFMIRFYICKAVFNRILRIRMNSLFFSESVCAAAYVSNYKNFCIYYMGDGCWGKYCGFYSAAVNCCFCICFIADKRGKNFHYWWVYEEKWANIVNSRM